MKNKKIALFGAFCLVANFANAATIVQWTFASNTNMVLNNSTTANLINADVGTGTVGGVHASSVTDWSSPVGNGSAYAYSSNNWAIGDYWEFSLSTTGFSNIALSWDQTGSNTGPADFLLSYSTNGVGFTNLVSYSINTLANGSSISWSSGNAVTTTSYSYNLSSITDLNNAATVYFRLVSTSNNSVNGGTVGTGGTDRIDNFTVSTVPEPAAYVLIAFALTGYVVFIRRRKLPVQAINS